MTSKDPYNFFIFLGIYQAREGMGDGRLLLLLLLLQHRQGLACRQCKTALLIQYSGKGQSQGVAYPKWKACKLSSSPS